MSSPTTRRCSVNITGIRAGDIVEVDKKGRRFHAVVNDKEDRELVLCPIEPNITYRRAKAREVVALWRKARRRNAADES
jgi:hypothetical protein